MFKYLRNYYPSLIVPDIQSPARNWHPFLLMLVAAASMTLMLNGPFYTALQTHIPGQAGLQFTLMFLVFLLNLMLMLLIAHGRMLKPIVLLLFFAGSLSLYFNQSFGVLIDKDMLQNAIETDPAEARGLLSSGLVLHLLQWMLLPLLLVSLVRVQRLSRRMYWQHLLVACTLFIVTLTSLGSAHETEKIVR